MKTKQSTVLPLVPMYTRILPQDEYAMGTKKLMGALGCPKGLVVHLIFPESAGNVCDMLVTA